MNTTRIHSGFSRDILCALAACLLTIVLLGGIGHAPAQAAQRAALELAQG